MSKTILRASQGKKVCRKGIGENKALLPLYLSIYDFSYHAKSMLRATGTVQ